MIELREVHKHYKISGGRKTVLSNVHLRINPGEKIGILGRNGAGKSTLIRLLSGAERPCAGTIHRGMRISWPLAFGGAFQGGLTGMDNLRFIARIYAADIPKVKAFVEEFSELGRYLYEPVKAYSAGMRARLAFALSMAVDFDCYLIDEIVAVGDKRFHDRCHEELFVKRGGRAMIIVSHDPHYIRQHCQRVSVLANGKLSNFDNVEDGFRFYEAQA